MTHTVDCPVCKEQHYVAKFSRFLKLSTKERYLKARTVKLCLNYFRAGHNLKNCSFAWTCRSCGQKHHTLLHFEQSSNTPIAAAAVAASFAAQDSATTSDSRKNPLLTMTSLSNSVVLLSTVLAEVLDMCGNVFSCFF